MDTTALITLCVSESEIDQPEPTKGTPRGESQTVVWGPKGLPPQRLVAVQDDLARHTHNRHAVSTPSERDLDPLPLNGFTYF